MHHFDQQQATPYPLLSAIAAKTERIELGTGVIDMRYENPLYMAELAAMADLIAAGRLQLGVDFNLKMLDAIVKEIKPALTTK